MVVDFLRCIQNPISYTFYRLCVIEYYVLFKQNILLIFKYILNVRTHVSKIYYIIIMHELMARKPYSNITNLSVIQRLG